MEKIETSVDFLEKTIAEEVNVQKVTDFLEKHGIKVKTEYGYYRNTFDVLKDVAEVFFK